MIFSVAGLDLSVIPFSFLVAVAISPSSSSLASSGLVVVVQVSFYSLLAGSTTCLGSVSLLECPFSDSFLEKGSEGSSCVSNTDFELSASVSFISRSLVWASRYLRPELSFSGIVWLVVFRNANGPGPGAQ